MNLIGNAVDAVNVGGEITVTSEMTEKETVLHIRDNGCGIDEDMLSAESRLDLFSVFRLFLLFLKRQLYQRDLPLPA